MISMTSMISLLCVLFSGAAAAETVAVVPIRGEPGPLSRNLVERLRGIEGIDVVNAIDVAGLLGPEVARRVAACEVDACVAEALAPLRADWLVLGEVAGDRVRARLVRTSSPSAPFVSVSVELEEAEATAIALASTLFENRRGFGLLVVETDPTALVSVDAQPRGAAPIGPLSISVGRHRIRAEAPDHDPEEREVEVRLGSTTRVELELIKPSGPLPFALVGGGAIAVAGGVVTSILASAIASDWREACGGDLCARGYTRDAYASDEGRVEALNVVTVALIAAGAGLAIAGGGAWLAR